MEVSEFQFRINLILRRHGRSISKESRSSIPRADAKSKLTATTYRLGTPTQ